MSEPDDQFTVEQFFDFRKKSFWFLDYTSCPHPLLHKLNYYKPVAIVTNIRSYKLTLCK